MLIIIIENNATVRQTAKQFRISKSTVHKDVTERLLQINPSLAREARKVLDMNKSERTYQRRDGYKRKSIFISMDRRRNFMKDKGGPAYIKSRAAFVSVSNAVISVIYCF